MGFWEEHDFMSYVFLRQDAFKKKYKLKGHTNAKGGLSGGHFPNNAKFLDKHSQMLIKRMNVQRFPLRDRVLTTLVYRVVGDYTFVTYFANRHFILDLKAIKNLADYLNEGLEILDIRYPLGISNGDELKALVEFWLDEVQLDSMRNRYARDLVEELIEKGFNLPKWLISEFVSDLSYIEELNITPDFVPYIDERALESYYKVKQVDCFEEDAYKAFVVNILRRYNDIKKPLDLEYIVNPIDVSHMLIGYYYYTNREYLPRNRLKVKETVDTLKVPRRLNEYCKKGNVYR